MDARPKLSTHQPQWEISRKHGSVKAQSHQVSSRRFGTCRRRQVTQQPPHKAGYTGCINSYSMQIHTANAQPIGCLIFDGEHKPFHALACPLRRRATSEPSRKDWFQNLVLTTTVLQHLMKSG